MSVAVLASKLSLLTKASALPRRTLLVRQRVHQRKIGRLGLPRHVGVAAGIHRDAQALISLAAARAAQVSGVDQGERGGLSVKPQLADEDVSPPSEDDC